MLVQISCVNTCLSAKVNLSAMVVLSARVVLSASDSYCSLISLDLDQTENVRLIWYIAGNSCMQRRGNVLIGTGTSAVEVA